MESNGDKLTANRMKKRGMSIRGANRMAKTIHMQERRVVDVLSQVCVAMNLRPLTRVGPHSFRAGATPLDIRSRVRTNGWDVWTDIIPPNGIGERRDRGVLNEVPSRRKKWA